MTQSLSYMDPKDASASNNKLEFCLVTVFSTISSLTFTICSPIFLTTSMSTTLSVISSTEPTLTGEHRNCGNLKVSETKKTYCLERVPKM